MAKKGFLKNNKRLKSRLVILIVCIAILWLSISTVSALPTYYDDNCEIWFYFSWMHEDGSWNEWVQITNENSTLLYEEMTLKIGQPVRLKIIVLTHVKSAIFIRFYEPGRTNAFDVLEGESHDKVVHYYVNRSSGEVTFVDPGTQVEYTWVLKVNGNWTKAHAPLNGFCYIHQPSVNDPESLMRSSFTRAYILDEQWTGPSYRPANGEINENGETTDPSTTPRGVPGFTLPLLLVSLVGFTLYGKKRKR